MTNLFALEKCGHQASRFFSSLLSGTAFLEDNARRCGIWSAGYNITVFVSWKRLGDNYLPVVIYLPSSCVDMNAACGIVIEMIGGPGEDISPGVNDLLPIALARNNQIVIRLGYSGTKHHSSFPEADFDLASRQLCKLVRDLRAINSDPSIVALGESMASHVVLDAMLHLPQKSVDGIALILPMVATPNAEKAYFDSKVRKTGSPIRRMRVNAPALFDNFESRFAEIRSDILFSSFFSREASDHSLAYYLDLAPEVPTIIAFSNTDEIGGSVADLKAKHDRVSLRWLELHSKGHSLDSIAVSTIAAGVLNIFQTSKLKGRH
ncbi:hypothetical protein ACU5AX_02900 [Sphingomonas sp. XXL09]|uniref:hypothetical protein n=1 Tax=Sphingomonas sp. XXL09 TaxID=3457787 RepID=UPI00406BD012